jgi:hypothetical protein
MSGSASQDFIFMKSAATRGQGIFKCGYFFLFEFEMSQRIIAYRTSESEPTYDKNIAISVEQAHFALTLMTFYSTLSRKIKRISLPMTKALGACCQ